MVGISFNFATQPAQSWLTSFRKQDEAREIPKACTSVSVLFYAFHLSAACTLRTPTRKNIWGKVFT